MTKVEANTNSWCGLDRPAGATPGSLEFKQQQKPQQKPLQKRRPSPFTDFPGWKAPKPAPAPLKPAPLKPAPPEPAVAPKPIDTGSPLGAAFKRASDAMKDHVKALEDVDALKNDPNIRKGKTGNELEDMTAKALKDIPAKELEAAEAQRQLSIAIADKARSMYSQKQAHTLEQAILDIVKTHAGGVETANEVLFREAAKQALNLVRTIPDL